VEPMIKTADTN